MSDLEWKSICIHEDFIRNEFTNDADLFGSTIRIKSHKSGAARTWMMDDDGPASEVYAFPSVEDAMRFWEEAING